MEHILLVTDYTLAMDNPHRSRVLALFRSFLRVAKTMPTSMRRDYIQLRARRDFKEQKEAKKDEYKFLIGLGETLLEQAQEQSKSLHKHFSSPKHHGF